MTRTTRLRLVARAAGRRPGVTLIELLVVIAIIGILIALTSAALQKTVERQKVRSSESAVFKLQQALDSEYERVVQRCAKEVEQQQIPQEVMNVCDRDEARAKAVWTAFQLRLNFPTTFDEANTTLTIVDSTGAARFTKTRPATFNPVAGIPSDRNPPLTGALVRPHEESGALLYLILSTRSVSGGGAMATSADDLTQAARKKVVFGTGANAKEFEAFSDAFQNSIGYERWAKQWPPPSITPAAATDEIQRDPYVDVQKVVRSPNGTVTVGNVDPLDPQGKVLGWQLTGTNDRRQLIKTGLEFDGKNRLITVYSFGRSIKNPAGTAYTPEDDILGYRLRRQGEKGNKQ